ncbi:hypothetical protein HAX54_047270, partial [Datura stramonium]|nr:hypothetical protein [Datura stramonium]
HLPNGRVVLDIIRDHPPENGNRNRSFFKRRSSGPTQSATTAPTIGNRTKKMSQAQGTPDTHLV